MSNLDARMNSAVTPQEAQSCAIEQARKLIYLKNPEVLLALLENPRLTLREILLLVRQRGSPAKVIKHIAENRKWNSDYAVILEIVRNPATPKPTALRFVKFLYRQDLARVALSPFLSPPVKQLAIHYLETRLEELEIGEKISLARESPAAILRILLHDQDPRVVAACLDNPRTPEGELLSIIGAEQTKESIIREIGGNQNWGARYSVRRAIVLNPRTPPDLLDDMMSHVLLQDLLEIMDSPALPLAHRLAARRSLGRKLAALPAAERVQLARSSRRRLLDLLIRDHSLEVVSQLLDNTSLKEGQVVSLAITARQPEILRTIAVHRRWSRNPKVKTSLADNRAVPDDIRRRLVSEDSDHE